MKRAGCEMKRSSKRKASACVNSEARIADDPPPPPQQQQPMDDVTPPPAAAAAPQLDLNLPAVDSPTPRSSITSCRGRHRSARGHKLKVIVPAGRGSPEPAVAPVDVTLTVPSLQVLNTSTTKSDVGVPLAANVNARVPSHASTTESDEEVISAVASAFWVPNASIDVGVPPLSSKKLIVSKTACIKNMNKLPAQSPAVSSLTVADPQSHGVSNEVVLQSMPAVSTVSSPRPSSTSTAGGPVVPDQRSTNKQTPVARVVKVAAKAVQVQVNNDPFSNMRLNIDNMSYEELLALQERIGYVSTGLSEKELEKARKVYTYRVKRRKTTTKEAQVDSKCSICQEEYVSGDKLGNLKCKHRYHLSCIEHWLRQKNWCPTCKTDVVVLGGA